MSIKSFIIRQASKWVRTKIKRDAINAVEHQMMILDQIVHDAKDTRFGRDHGFEQIENYDDFKSAIPIRNYEDLKPYFDAIAEGEADVLYPGKPKYLAKTSGTTSGAKYIPITPNSLPNHISGARNALLNYIALKNDASIFGGKVIFLSGSPVLDTVGGIKTGRLSGIVNHEIPTWLKGNQLPSYATNCIEEWEEKLDRIIDETLGQDLRLISGIPPWVKMYFDRLLERTGKQSILEIFPNFSLFVHGGVNFKPYGNAIYDLIGARIDTLETYPASEGFIAYQDSISEEGLLLNTNSGIFFEFVPAGEAFDESPNRISLQDVQLGVNYAIILNSNAGLWGYLIGDTVTFVHKNPYRLIVTGRIKHFISAFGEHVIAKEVEQAMQEVSTRHNLKVAEFTVAPMVSDTDAPSYHEWLIAFDSSPNDLDMISAELDASMCEQNVYYKDLIDGQILHPLKITALLPDAFERYMSAIGKLGGQNKVPRLSNDRDIADRLSAYANASKT